MIHEHNRNLNDEEGKKEICIIISGGEFSELPDDIAQPSYIIACDRGWQHAEKMRLTPDLIVGDFDSSPIPETDVKVEKFPCEKDDTDTMIAARRAVQCGYKDIVICCAFGGRLDHTIANIQTAAWLCRQGGSVRLTGFNTDAYIISGMCDAEKIASKKYSEGSGDITTGNTKSLNISRREGWSFSVFSLTDKCEGVSILGTKYECKDITLTSSFPLGVSNEWKAEKAVLTVRKGMIMAVESKLESNNE